MMLSLLLLCFFMALLPLVLGKSLRPYYPWLGLVPLGLFGYFLSCLPLVVAGQGVMEAHPWVPSLGIHLDMHLDGLSLLFSLLITGIGALVFFYAAVYMKQDAAIGRFFGWISLFMGAMLGVVLSDNVLTLFVFWELTSISSFFLIGYKQADPAARRAALTALVVTGSGGLALLAGGLLLGQMADTHSLTAMRLGAPDLVGHAHYLVLTGLIFLAAFTKSAQFPFHFWLPGAMKAPTPVSTYLHSATMVKAGVYLLWRLSPLLSGHPWWSYGLLTVGGITMVLSALQTLRHTDLKSILAYSTLSALGILVFLTGVGSPLALRAALTFLLVHALYKAALFLVTGILDKAAGTRDITRLAGWRRWMPWVALAGALAAFSNAGLPPFVGFVGKDLIYESLLAGGGGWWVALMVLVNVLLLWAGFQVGIRPFMGTAQPDPSALHYTPGPGLWWPPLLLGVLGLLLGLMPAGVGVQLIDPAWRALFGNGTLPPLALWHGWNGVLLLSGLTLAAGGLGYRLFAPSGRVAAWSVLHEGWAAGPLFYRAFQGLRGVGDFWTRWFQHGLLRNYVFLVLLFLVALLGWTMSGLFHLPLLPEGDLSLTSYEVILLVMMFSAILFTVFTDSRLAAVAAMGVVGYALCLIFVFYSAPDLAMTQFTIDTLTVILFVLILFRLPKYLPFSSATARIRDGVLALSFGGLIVVLILAVLQEPSDPQTGAFYAQNAYLLAKGKNVVNVILVDFRGLDTLVEIAVLTIAAIGVFGLLKLRMHKSEKS